MLGCSRITGNWDQSSPVADERMAIGKWKRRFTEFYRSREMETVKKNHTMKTFTLCRKYIENCSVILWTLLRPKYLKHCSGYFGSSHWVYTADMKTVKTHYGKRAPLSAQLCAVHCSLLRCLQFIQPQFAAIQFSATKRNSVVNQKTIVSQKRRVESCKSILWVGPVDQEYWCR